MSPLKSLLMSTLMSSLKSEPPMTILESYQPILGSDMSRPLKSQKKVCGGGWVETKNIVRLRSISDLDLTWTWTWT